MNLGLAGTTALVLGASAGLGLATAEALAEEEANIVIFARNTDDLEHEAQRWRDGRQRGRAARRRHRTRCSNRSRHLRTT